MVVYSTSALGFGRMGPNRELKFALEKYWRKDINSDELLTIANQVEESAWKLQVDAGIDRITVGDYCLYDNVRWLNMLICVSAVYHSIFFSLSHEWIVNPT